MTALLPLFDHTRRVYLGPKEYSEPDFSYLDRSVRPPFARIRSTLESWFAKYPADAAVDLRERFRSDRNEQHQGAFFELVCHQMLKRLGCRVAVSVNAGATERIPDFLVTSPAGFKFYFEATIAAEPYEMRPSKLVDQIVDAINTRVKSADYFLLLDDDGELDQLPPVGNLCTRIQGWLAQLEYDKVYASRDNYGHLPKFRFRHQSWTLFVNALPCSPESRGAPLDRIVGSPPSTGGFTSFSAPIRTSVHKKGTHYGELEFPFVVAINEMQAGTPHRDIIEALFGKLEYRWAQDSSGHVVQLPPRRQRNGAFLGPEGPRLTSVSSLLVFGHLVPWNLSTAKLRLYKNLFAQSPSPFIMDQFPRADVGDGNYILRRGRGLASVLGLPKDWPGFSDDEE